jgi:hypothetical protein
LTSLGWPGTLDGGVTNYLAGSVYSFTTFPRNIPLIPEWFPSFISHRPCVACYQSGVWEYLRKTEVDGISGWRWVCIFYFWLVTLGDSYYLVLIRFRSRSADVSQGGKYSVVAVDLSNGIMSKRLRPSLARSKLRLVTGALLR